MEELRLTCLENNGYETPELNDKLYLHFRGFKRIENLDAYTGCKSIWLDSNGFDQIENLDKLTELRCIYLSKNLINRISGLDQLSKLTILDLSYNRLTLLDNLACCPNLQTLNVAHNSLANAEAIDHLRQCPALTNLDITNNRLECDEAIMNVIQGMPALVTLSINGNEVTKLPTFRKRMIGNMPSLGYLDRPIDELERVVANAFLVGGVEAENVARTEWREVQNQKRIDQMNEFRNWQAEQQKIREQARAEGRSLITEFTPEEQEQRRLEAQAASEAERKIVELGVENVGKKFWQMEGRAGNQDPLDAAIAAVEEENRKKTEAAKAQVEEEEEAVELSDVSPVIEETAVEEVSAQVQELSVEDNAVEESKNIEISAEEIAAKEAELQRARQEAEDARQRELLVQDSLAIYKKQQQDKKKGIKNEEEAPKSTWEIAMAVEEVERPLYWSETMDLELAKQVKACVFDFDAISKIMTEKATEKKLDNSSVHKNPALLTNEVCRLRWAELDANQWCLPAPGTTAQDTVFRINLSDDLLQRTGGAQPSYDALASLATGAKPAYLKMPTAFPSVQTIDLDTELDLD